MENHKIRVWICGPSKLVGLTMEWLLLTRTLRCSVLVRCGWSGHECHVHHHLLFPSCHPPQPSGTTSYQGLGNLNIKKIMLILFVLHTRSIYFSKWTEQDFFYLTLVCSKVFDFFNTIHKNNLYHNNESPYQLIAL